MIGFGILPLTRGVFTVVDLDDFETLHTKKLQVSGDGHYAIYNGEYLHRRLLGCQGRAQQGDHVNRNGLDNRRSNLRKTNNSGNQRNKDKSKNNRSGVLGVSRHKPTNRWRAYINVGKRGTATTIYLGLFDTIEEAAKARKIAEARYWGTT